MTTESSKSLQAVRGRIGGLVKASKYPASELTSAARQTFLRKFEQQVDPDGVLPPEERARRAEAARRAHFARLALLSAKARRQKAARRQNGGGR